MKSWEAKYGSRGLHLRKTHAAIGCPDVLGRIGDANELYIVRFDLADMFADKLGAKMRFLFLVAALLASTTQAQESTKKITNAEIFANQQRFRACIKFSAVTQPVRLMAKFDDTGIVSRIDEIDPKDTDEYRADLELAKAEILRCQPFKMYPEDKFKGETFTMPFNFYSKGERSPRLAPALWDAWRDQIAYCRTRPQKGPDVSVAITYREDGTVLNDIVLTNQSDDPEYLLAAAEVVKAIRKCQPIILPNSSYEHWRRMRFTFRSIDGARAAEQAKAAVRSREGAAAAPEVGKSQ